MTKPAARKGDDHSCPKKNSDDTPHIGGAISGGSEDVFINDKPAARVDDPAKCHGPEDKIVSGSSTVFINGKPAARVGDATDHGGKITVGSGNVFIGSGGNPVNIGGKGIVNFGSKGQIFIGGGCVAANTSSAEDLNFLALTIYGEARSESDASRKAVAWIIRNRKKDGKHGDSYKEVVKQTKNFSCWNEGDVNYPEIMHPGRNGQEAAWRRCQEIAKEVDSAPESENPLSNIIHYFSDDIKDGVKWEKKPFDLDGVSRLHFVKGH